MHTPGRTTAAGIPSLAAASLIGIGGLYSLPELPPAWIFLSGFLVAIPLPVLFPRVRLLLGVALLSAGWACHLANLHLSDRLDSTQNGRDVWLQGEIAELPERQGEDWRFIFAPDNGPVQRLRVAWHLTGKELHAGQCLRLRLRLRQPRGLSNPGGFDYEAWLFREGIGATAYVKSAEGCAGAGQRRWTAVPAYELLQLRQQIVDAVQRILQGHPMQGIVLGLTVGDASAITDEQWQVLRRTGTTHIVSISGLHVALVAGLVFFLARWAWALIPGFCLRLPAQQAAAAAAAFAALLYSALAGMSIPTQRSLIMLLVALGAIGWRRHTQPVNLLSLALIAVLLWNPVAVLYPGFWLSFAAIAWIGYVAAGRLAQPSRLRGLVGLQLALSFALMPLCLYWFSETSLVGPLANLLMIPLYSVLTAWLLIGVLMLALWPWAAEWLLRSGTWILDLSWQGLQWLASVSHVYWTWPAPCLAVLLLAMAGLALLLAPRGFPSRGLGIVFCLPLFFPKIDVPAVGSFDIAVLDVGQGLAAVLRTQGHALLFDAGPASRGGFNTGETVVLPYLRQAGIKKLDGFVLSHTDMDHRGGLEAVRKGVQIAREIGTDRGEPCRAGQQWTWDGVSFELLYPAGDSTPGETASDNNSSCVLRVAAGNHAVLLTGDIEQEAEAGLLASGSRLAADLMVVPHHGSRSSSSPAFVDRVHPAYAIVPAGWQNRWGFPKQEVVARYLEDGATVAVTGQEGALMARITPDAGVIDLCRWRRLSRHFWNLD